MSVERRLNDLESHYQPSETDDLGLCMPCAGRGAYRRRIERARRDEAPDYSDRCVRCGRLTYSGAMMAERRALGFEG